MDVGSRSLLTASLGWAPTHSRSYQTVLSYHGNSHVLTCLTRPDGLTRHDWIRNNRLAICAFVSRTGLLSALLEQTGKKNRMQPSFSQTASSWPLMHSNNRRPCARRTSRCVQRACLVTRLHSASANQAPRIRRKAASRRAPEKDHDLPDTALAPTRRHLPPAIQDHVDRGNQIKHQPSVESPLELESTRRPDPGFSHGHACR
ncbi:hypothetical protein B0J12DRAFT_98808 [Macrophomina phaseolina]|uniref:Uncharacterized protein n=1 Tax=Macrophomina phaseolina TaxID=35725 RepID=A0ABQ8GCI1_9PEZI|nr:hypothetical protein B0J12DRAFT_98808 [Macrophomina phaseolina]